MNTSKSKEELASVLLKFAIIAICFAAGFALNHIENLSY